MKTAYLLLKDTPEHNAGEVFVRKTSNDFLWEAISGKMPCIPENIITNSPTWYQLIDKEMKFTNGCYTTDDPKEIESLNSFLEEKRYTKEEMLEAEEKAFNAAKQWMKIPIITKKGNTTSDLMSEDYKTFSDYKNNISQASLLWVRLNKLFDEIKNDYKK